MARRVTAWGLAEAGASLAAAAFYGAFAFAHLRQLATHPRASLALIVAIETLAAAVFLVRRPARSVALSAWAFATTALGVVVPMLVRPTAAPRDSVAGQVLQALGLGLALAGFASINRSIGFLPANRGIRTGGAYRLVRHPLYAAYTLTNLGYLASNLDTWNAVVVVAAVAAQILRIRVEEAFLAADPEYAAYARRTRWRLLPLVY